MFFLITNIVIGKYYPSLVTQLIIGCACYALSFFIIKDVMDSESFNEYKYYILSLIAADIIFITYKAKKCINTKTTNQTFSNISKENKIDTTTSELKTGSMHSVTLSSEINDFRISHDLSVSDPNDENSMFSTSDDKSEISTTESLFSESNNSSYTNTGSDKTITSDFSSESQTSI